MNRFKKRFLAVVVSAVCVKYSLDKQEKYVYASEITNLGISGEAATTSGTTGTAGEIQDENLTDEQKVAISRINSGIETLNDYTLLGIKSVQSYNINSIKYGIKIAVESKGQGLVLDEIKNNVGDTIKKVQQSFENINGGTGALEDYNIIATEGVTSINLVEINELVKGKKITTLSRMQSIVNSVIEPILKINNGTESETDYVSIGQNNVQAENIKAIREAIAKERDDKGSDLTKAEIIEVVEAVLKIIDKCYENINGGIATLDDYKLIGLTGVNDNNIKDVNDYLQGKKSITLFTTQIFTNEIVGRLTSMNNGAEEVSDYLEFGLKEIKQEHINAIRVGIKSSKENKGSDLVKSEIIEEVNNALRRIGQAYEDITSGKGTIDGYKLIGVTGVDDNNLGDVDEMLQGQDVNRLSELQEATDAVTVPLLKINIGQEVLEDYITIGIYGVDSENIDAVRQRIKIEKEKKGNNLTIAEIKKVIAVCGIFAKINLGQAILEEYIFIGANGVTLSYLDYINGELKGCNYTTLEEVQAKIDDAVKRRKAFEKINTGKGRLEDYIIVGIRGVTVDNLPYVNVNVRNKNLMTPGTLQPRVDTIIELYDAYKRKDDIIAKINNGTATVDDYGFIGFIGVTVDNIVYINVELKGKNYKTVSEIQVVISNVIKIQAAYDRINAGKATLDDYTLVGATGILVNNLVYVNIELLGQNYRSLPQLQLRINNVIEVQLVCDRINVGEGTLADFEILGIRGVTVENLVYMNIELKGKNYRTIKEIQLRVDNVVKIQLSYDRINVGKGTLDDYNIIGLTGITVNNLVYVNIELKGKNYRSIPDIQVVINNVVKIQLAYDRISEGQATLDDYTLIGVTGITVDNLVFINLELKEKNYRNLPDLQIRITNIIKLHIVYDRINAGEGTLDDYKLLGIDRITIDNLLYINLELKGKNYITIAELKVRINNVIDIDLAYGRINRGEGTLDDYMLLGVAGVTVNNLVYVNVDLKGKNYRVLTDIQVIINNVVNIQAAYYRINEGEGTLEDYTLIGLEGVTITNIVNINIDLKGRNYRSLLEIQVRINNVIKIQIAYDRIKAGEGTTEDYELLGIKVTVDNKVDITLAYDRIHKGEGTLDDYILIGLTGVTVNNLVQINAKLNGDNFISLLQMQVKINNVIDIQLALNRIDEGKGTLDDYYLIGVTGVTINNIVYVNAEIQGKHYITIADITVISNTVININVKAAIDRINKGEGTLDDYVVVGIPGVTVNNLIYVNAELKGKNYVTVANIQIAINNVINIKVTEALDRVNKGEATLEDYGLLGIEGVTINNIVQINLEVKGKNYVTIVDLKVYTNTVVHVIIEGALERINNGQGTIEDYKLVGVIGVTVNNIVYINERVRNKNYVTVAELKVVVNTVVNININEAYDRINSGIATLNDYALLGVTGVTVNNIVEVNAKLKGNNYIAVVDLQVTTNTVINVCDALKRINAGEGNLNDYILIGVPGVTVNNLVYVNAELKGKSITGPDEIRVIAAKIVITDEIYLRINLGIGTVDDYASLGIEGVTINNIVYLNAIFEGKKYTTKVELEVIAKTVVNVSDVYGRINLGTATIDDYVALGIVGITIDNLVYVNAELKGKNYLTLPKIQVNVATVVKITETIGRINRGEGTLADYNRIGMAGVTVENLVYINGEIKGRGYKTVSDIEVSVNTTVKIFDAYGRINAGTATLGDYTLLGIIGVTVNNLVYVNGELRDAKDIKPTAENIKEKVAEVQKVVSKAVSIADILKIINEGKETISVTGNIQQYHLLDRKGINKEKLSLIQQAIKVAKYTKERDLTQSEILAVIDDTLNNIDSSYIVPKILGGLDVAKESKGSALKIEESLRVVNDIKNRIEEAFQKIVLGIASVEDYQIVNVTGVNAENIVWINAEVKEGIDVKLTQEDINGKINNVQIAINRLLDIYKTTKVINDGKEVLNISSSKIVKQYEEIERTGVNESNLALIRKAIIIEKKIKGRDLTKSEILEVVDNTLNNIDSQYIITAIKNKIDKFEEVKGEKLSKEEALTIANSVRNSAEVSFQKIVSGNASLEDYISIEIKGVTANNLVWINAEIKEAVDVKLSAENVNGKLNQVQAQINKLLDIYKTVKVINDGAETLNSSDSKNVYEYMLIDRPGIIESKLVLIRQAISIGKYIEGRDLTKTEIQKIIDETLKDIDSVSTIPTILDALNKEQKDRGNKLTKEDAAQVKKDAEDRMDEAFKRIVLGAGSIDDYCLINVTGVTVENLVWINAEIKEAIDVKLSAENMNGKIKVVQAQINQLLDIYKIVKVINDGKETLNSSASKNVYEYMLIDKPGINQSQLGLIRQAICIGKYIEGRDLTKSEIQKIIDDTLSNVDSSRIIPTILEEINTVKEIKGDEFTKEDAAQVKKDIQDRINEAFKRVALGDGSVDDYSLINVTGVTTENLEWINAEIKEYIDVQLSAEDENGKINQMQIQINKLLDIYKVVKVINDGKETLNSSSSENVYQYMLIDRPGINQSQLVLIRQAICIGKYIEGRDLTKTEIQKIIDDTLSNVDSSRIIPTILDEINTVKEVKVDEFTKEDAAQVKKDTEIRMDEALERVALGDGSIEDYNLIKVTGITEDNLVWMNAEIKERIDVQLSSEDVIGKIDNVQASIDTLVGLYKTVKIINDGKETLSITKNVVQYITIGRKGINQSKLLQIRAGIITEKLSKGRELTKTEILAVIDGIVI